MQEQFFQQYEGLKAEITPEKIIPIGNGAAAIGHTVLTTTNNKQSHFHWESVYIRENGDLKIKMLSVGLDAPAPQSPSASSSSTAGSGTTSAAGKMSEQEIKSKLESEGYTQVSDIASTPKGISATAMKDGKAVRLVIDSGGQVKERQGD